MKFESREVLAVAYTAKQLDEGPMLRHAVEVDDQGNEIRVMCRRVKFENLADANAGNPKDPPTCPACIRAVRRATVLPVKGKRVKR